MKSMQRKNSVSIQPIIQSYQIRPNDVTLISFSILNLIFLPPDCNNNVYNSERRELYRTLTLTNLQQYQRMMQNRAIQIIIQLSILYLHKKIFERITIFKCNIKLFYFLINKPDKSAYIG